jgi:hypothetical protein
LTAYPSNLEVSAIRPFSLVHTFAPRIGHVLSGGGHLVAELEAVGSEYLTSAAKLSMQPRESSYGGSSGTDGSLGHSPRSTFLV